MAMKIPRKRAQTKVIRIKTPHMQAKRATTLMILITQGRNVTRTLNPCCMRIQMEDIYLSCTRPMQAIQSIMSETKVNTIVYE